MSHYTDGWVVSEECRINNKLVTSGTELSIRGERGRFKFLKYVINSEHEWIDVLGPTDQFRSFRIDQVKTVHRINRRRDNANV
jgi:hypothetical protein